MTIEVAAARSGGRAFACLSRAASWLAASNSAKVNKTLNVFMPLPSFFQQGKKSEPGQFWCRRLADKRLPHTSGREEHKAESDILRSSPSGRIQRASGQNLDESLPFLFCNSSLFRGSEAQRT